MTSPFSNWAPPTSHHTDDTTSVSLMAARSVPKVKRLWLTVTKHCTEDEWCTDQPRGTAQQSTGALWPLVKKWDMGKNSGLKLFGRSSSRLTISKLSCTKRPPLGSHSSGSAGSKPGWGESRVTVPTGHKISQDPNRELPPAPLLPPKISYYWSLH